MVWRLLRAVVILPGSAFVVPALILTATSVTGIADDWIGAGAPAFWLAALFGLAGLALAAWTLRLLLAEVRTPSALMDPLGKLAIRGPYRHVRNPLICAALLFITAETLLFDSWPLAVWLVGFYVASAIYIPRIEERGLERRFGAAYRRYKAHVPRWFPSPLAYDPAAEQRLSERGT